MYVTSYIPSVSCKCSTKQCTTGGHFFSLQTIQVSAPLWTLRYAPVIWTTAALMMQAVMIVRNVAMMVVESSVLSHCQNPMLIKHARPCHVSSITAQPKRGASSYKLNLHTGLCWWQLRARCHENASKWPAINRRCVVWSNGETYVPRCVQIWSRPKWGQVIAGQWKCTQLLAWRLACTCDAVWQRVLYDKIV